jgi:pilus assembly protein CpaE
MPEKILIVDDDVETLRLVGLMLQRQGYEIAAASNGTQAIAMAQSELPDLIVLDIMMPDMDGYQVTKQLRGMSETSSTPILMFTAKSQVDDKVAGYDAGVDDYLTKPVHPAELVAHIKALLSRTRSRPASEVITEKGYLVGVTACRGGMGCSSMALNLAACMSQVTKAPTIAVELRPGQGTWGPDLGFNNAEGLNNLLQRKPSEINAQLIEQSLVSTGFGTRLLLAPVNFGNMDFVGYADKIQAIINAIALMKVPTFFDIGTGFLPGFDKICRKMDEIIILTEPQLVTVKRTKKFIEQLNTSNITGGKMIELVLFNRVRADIQMSSMQVTEELDGMPISVMIPPAPELANQASQKHAPMYNLQPEGLVAQQLMRLTEIIHEHIRK